MIDLPYVTLIAYDNTDQPEKTLRVMQYCQRFFNFGQSVLVCRVSPSGIRNERTYPVPDKGYPAAQLFESVTLGNYVKTDYSLFVSHDGYILNPDKWVHDWLDYDFIGAPWPPNLVLDPRYRVGNTGFCIRSRKFMNLCSLTSLFYTNNIPSDVFACQMMRPLFEAYGIKYAPIDIAADFAWELNIPEYPSGRPDAFGFHGIGNKKVPDVNANPSNS